MKTWSQRDLDLLRELFPVTRTRDIEIPGRTRGQIRSQAKNLHLKKSAAFLASAEARKLWTAAEKRLLRKIYPDGRTSEICAQLARSPSSVFGMATKLGLAKSDAFHADAKRSGRFDKLSRAGEAFRFQKGLVPANKGVRRPGYAPGRMAETQFRKGHFPANRDPDFYVIGALRIDSDGYISMRVSFAPGGCGWRYLHLILWEDAHGPVPPGHVVVFKNKDKLDCELENLELLTFAENLRRNSIARYPKPLRSAIVALGQFKRRVREKQNRGSAQPSV